MTLKTPLAELDLLLEQPDKTGSQNRCSGYRDR